MKKLKIALLGSLPKGDIARKDFIDWKDHYEKVIKADIPYAVFLNGDLISDSEGTEVVVGHDLWIIQHADIIIVNAPSKIGAGTAQEMVLAKYFKKFVICIIPKDSHHRKSDIVFHGVTIKDWIHPFLDLTSDVIVEDISETIEIIKEYSESSGKRNIKDFSIFEDAIDTFKAKLPAVVESYTAQGW